MVNLSGVYNVTNVQEMFSTFNTATDSNFLALILVTTFILIFMIFKNWDTGAVWIINSFVCTFIAVLFVVGLGWGGVVYIVVPFVSLALAFIFTAVKKT